ncbi:MAG TPA: helix-turn-helix domain-containing protein [Actinocrinis sp.]|jgi:DNA-binding transcriptional ArsR family regulator
MAKGEAREPKRSRADDRAEDRTGGKADRADEVALPLGPQPLPELIEHRHIADAETMKALADPLRLNIMRVLGRDAHIKPRIMTVKQLAEELGEPATKLYWHIKQLLGADLIQIAELRLAGGIVEQHYRVAQAGWAVNTDVPGEDRAAPISDELFGVADAAIDDYFVRYERALREGRTSVRSEDSLKHPPHVRSVGTISDFRVSQQTAADFAERLHTLVKEFTDEPPGSAEGDVQVNLMAMFYATEVD